MELHFPDSLDEHISRRCMQRWPTHMWFNAWMTVAARWTPILMMGSIALIVVGFFPGTASPRCLHASAFAAIVAAIVGRLVNEPLSRWVRRPRPFESLQVLPLISHKGGDAFPSNHTTGAFALAFGCSHIPGYFEVLLALAILLSTARVYTGLHHLSDVIAGALHGSLLGSIAAWIAVVLLHTCR